MQKKTLFRFCVRLERQRWSIPYIDFAEGLIIGNGRLKHAELPEHAQHPIFLAADHRLASFIIADAHDKINHTGVEHTLSVVRRSYYLTQGLRSVRKTLARCVKCRRSVRNPNHRSWLVFPRKGCYSSSDPSRLPVLNSSGLSTQSSVDARRSAMAFSSPVSPPVSCSWG